jgi:F0F1-type ATP synthase assembly protein I
MEIDPGKSREKKDGTRNEAQASFSAMSLAWELGYMIAIPLVALALGGRFLDKELGTGPLMLLSGVCLAIIVSSYMVYKKTTDIMDKK